MYVGCRAFDCGAGFQFELTPTITIRRSEDDESLSSSDEESDQESDMDQAPFRGQSDTDLYPTRICT